MDWAYVMDNHATRSLKPRQFDDRTYNLAYVRSLNWRGLRLTRPNVTVTWC